MNKLFFNINHVEVSDSALKHFETENGCELLRGEIQSLAKKILHRRQGEEFPVDPTFSIDGSAHFTILSSTVSSLSNTAFWSREWGVVMSGTTATINHYLEPNNIKRHNRKHGLLNKANNCLSYSLDLKKL